MRGHTHRHTHIPHTCTAQEEERQLLREGRSDPVFGPATRWHVLEAASKAHNGEPFRMEASIAKITATEAGGRVVDRCMQIHGGLGVAKDLPFERWYREMRIRRIGEGPNEVQRHIVARDVLGMGLR